MKDHSEEVASGERFEFGKNWLAFLEKLDEERITRAEDSLRDLLGLESFEGKTFLDVGSGSGLFSLAARRLGATVLSFDYDPRSAACTAELKKLYFPDDPSWEVTVGSILNRGFTGGLSRFDVVYAWGVLHHTGEMWRAVDTAAGLTSPRGLFAVALYNDQGRRSRWWKGVKKIYNRMPRGLKWIILYPAALRLWGPAMVRDLLRLRPFETWRTYKEDRGMSPWRDVVDWVGGYPFEVARSDEVVARLEKAGFKLQKLKISGGHGCNEYLFGRTPPEDTIAGGL